MIVVEITERNRRKPSRVVFNDDTIAEMFIEHSRGRGARVRQLTLEEAREHVAALRDRAAKRSDWRAGGGAAEIAKRIAEARQRERHRDVTVQVPVPRPIKSELDRIGRIAGRPIETLIRAAIAAFLKAARREATGRR